MEKTSKEKTVAFPSSRLSPLSERLGQANSSEICRLILIQLNCQPIILTLAIKKIIFQTIEVKTGPLLKHLIQFSLRVNECDTFA